jgi:bacterioferritin-associated ferredoxin
MTKTEKAIRDFCGHHADWWPSITQVQEILALAQPCPTCEALARAVLLDQTSHDTSPLERKPLTDKQILANETLRYYFGQNGGAGPVSKQGRKVVDAIEALHGIKETEK